MLALLLVAGIAFGGTLLVRMGMDRFGGAGAVAEESESDPTETTPTGPATPDAEALANPVACVPEIVDVAVGLESASVRAGSEVPVAVTITNTGQVPCLLDVGHGSLAMAVSSGDDTVWTNEQCPSGSAERPILLDINAQEERVLAWSGQRSAEGCPSGAAEAEPGTYRIDVSLDVDGTEVSNDEVLTLQ
ncbi:hypothetical protein [Ruania halotolerans]|uniref:hypothetical protein n=1 Tax=Ruania halotolerans TaxID=2897773 RepID=UPI001E5C8761|nr:hypothetical protein [Ruania halotolerans]UFU05841.1 hypothetical protein LQF10_15610 [Ruania halotolerans]